ncbi:hypothetical protein [Rhizobium leguminosarum]
MSKGNLLSSPVSYQPDAFNPNAYNLLSYRRPGTENLILYFPSRPAGGHDTLEELVGATSAIKLTTSQNSGEFKQLADRSARVRFDNPDTPRGIVVPFVESVFPSAAVFNAGTGGWTSAQVQLAMATVDRANVFRALAEIPGQEAAGIVVESPNALAAAARAVGGVSDRTVVASSLAPGCMAVSEVSVSQILENQAEVFEAAAATAPGRRVVLLPFTGLNVGQQEVLVDGIFANGKMAFTAFSEKRRVDPEPPYFDRRITTLGNLERKTAGQLTKVIGNVFNYLGLTNAVFHAEFAMTGNGPLMTDLMARPGGGFIPEMIRERYSVDLRAAHVYSAFSMAEELERIAASAEKGRTHVAIGLCYIEESRQADAKAGAALADALASDSRVINYNVETIATNASVGLPDVRASIAVRGTTADQALETLDAFAAEYGLS